MRNADISATRRSRYSYLGDLHMRRGDATVWHPLGRRRGKSDPPLPLYKPPPKHSEDFPSLAEAREFIDRLREKYGADNIAITIVEPRAPRARPRQLALI